MKEHFKNAICLKLHNQKWGSVFLCISFVLLLFSVSCKKDNSESTGPAISLKNGTPYVSGDTSIFIGKSFRTGIDVSSGDANITNLIIKLTNETTTTFLDSGMNVASFSLDKMLPKTVNPKDIWTFIVRDKNGRSASVSLTVYADSNSVYQPVVYLPSVFLGAQDNQDTGSFYDVDFNHRYNLIQAYTIQDSIDILYYYDAITTDENTIASPNANIDNTVFPGTYGLVNWTIKNETRYLQLALTETEFTNISNDSLLIASYNEPLAKRKAKNLVAENVYSFKTASGKYGIFRVVKVYGTSGGSIEIEIKIQQ
jgi:hypothetical protein